MRRTTTAGLEAAGARIASFKLSIFGGTGNFCSRPVSRIGTEARKNPASIVSLDAPTLSIAATIAGTLKDPTALKGHTIFLVRREPIPQANPAAAANAALAGTRADI